MSFQPRTPIGLPANMMTPGYTFAPMGMMPMGVIPPTAVTPLQPVLLPAQPVKIMTPPPSVPMNTAHVFTPPRDDGPKGPVTTVFVGNISERAPDQMVKLMLQRCGSVLSWKRVQGASGKLQGFGFCEYERPESTLRCIRLLNDWQIADKKLVVKVDAKTKTLLDEYETKKKQAEAEATGDNADEAVENDEQDYDIEGNLKIKEKPSGDGLDQDTMAADILVKAGLDRIIVENAVILAKIPPPVETRSIREQQQQRLQHTRRVDITDGSLDGVELEDDRKNALSKEILSFRKLHKDDEPPQKTERTERDLLMSEERRLREFQRTHDRELYKAKMRIVKSRSKSKSPPSIRDNHRERDRDRDRDRDRSERRRSRSRDHSREHSSVRDRERREREKAIDLEEEAHERRKLEKKLREKEAAYRERLKIWENRESKKHREYRKERDRVENKNVEEDKEARRLKEFLEDYDDERDDVKYYKGSALSRRMKEREKEIELDDRDRAREKDELDEIKKRLHDEGHPDVEAEIFRLERQRNEHLRPRPIKIEMTEKSRSRRRRQKSVTPEDEKPQPPILERMEPNNGYDAPELTTYTNEKLPVEDDMFSRQSPVVETAVEKEKTPSPPPSGFKPIPEAIIRQESSPSNEAANTKRKKLTVVDVFNQDEDDDSGAKKRKLVPLDYNDDANNRDEKKPKTLEEKRAHIKTLIERIPTAKEELFEFPLDWSIVDASLMDKRIKPWVNKKIVEYIGEEEPTLTEFICQKVISKSSPQNILNDVAMVLDEEAEVFIVKMWRLLIYETEAKKAGLVK